jgi:hypothetical protein
MEYQPKSSHYLSHVAVLPSVPQEGKITGGMKRQEGYE